MLAPALFARASDKEELWIRFRDPGEIARFLENRDHPAELLDAALTVICR